MSGERERGLLMNHSSTPRLLKRPKAVARFDELFNCSPKRVFNLALTSWNNEDIRTVVVTQLMKQLLM